MKSKGKYLFLSCLSLLLCAGCTESSQTESYWVTQTKNDTHYDAALFSDHFSLYTVNQSGLCPISDYIFRTDNLIEITTADGLKIVCSPENVMLISTENYTGETAIDWN